MNDNEKLNGGTILTPANPSNKQQFTPRDLNEAQLASLDHADWLEGFSTMMATGTAVQMTPFRQGVVTRSHWAAKYIKLIERKMKQQEAEIIRLKEKLDGRTDPADGCVSI